MKSKAVPTILGVITAIMLNACATPIADTKPMAPVAVATTNQPMIAALAPSDNLNAVLWQQTAAEYHANSLQSFKQAQISLELLLKQPTMTAAVEQTGNFSGLPPAVIVDVD